MAEIKDIKFGEMVSAKELVESFSSTGFQASQLADAVELIERMKKEECTILLGFTANLIASGVRGVVGELCEKGFVDVVVTTAGSIDHDVIKSFKPYLKGDFFADDAELHKKGINRIGNILVPNDRFELFEKEIRKWFGELYKKNKVVSPKELNEFIGTKLNKSSFLYWCSKNNIPVFCPGITDGAIGLQMYFFKQEHNEFVVDVTRDMKDLEGVVLNAEKTAGIVLGGGITKHHIIGANILREGLDYAVYITTASELDGSLSGARTHEAKSWGKIREEASTVNVYGDATIIFPLIVASLKEKKIL